MSRQSFSILIIGFLALTPVVIIEAPQILQWTSLELSQQLTYAPVLLLWLVSLVFIGMLFMQRRKSH